LRVEVLVIPVRDTRHWVVDARLFRTA